MKRTGRVKAALRNELEMISAGCREARVTANPAGVVVGARRPPPRALESWGQEAAACSIPGRIRAEEPRDGALTQI